MPAWVCISDTALVPNALHYPKSSVELIAVMWDWAVPCVRPRAAGVEGGLVPSCRVAGGRFGGFTFLAGQTFAFFSPKHLLTCSILGSCEHGFKGRTEVTVGYQPYAMRCHHEISCCCWFKTNGGNV